MVGKRDKIKLPKISLLFETESKRNKQTDGESLHA